jgi:hypothetical protein
MARICWELAPPFHVHPFERFDRFDHRFGSAGAGKFECAEQIGQKLAEKRVMMVE